MVVRVMCSLLCDVFHKGIHGRIIPKSVWGNFRVER
jgi:hypothetical protein